MLLTCALHCFTNAPILAGASCFPSLPLPPTAGVKTIVVFDRVSAVGLWPGERRVMPVQGDLLNKADLTSAMTSNKVGAVLHVASPHPNGDDRELFKRVNVTGTATVIAACLEAGVGTLVYTSSASVVWHH